MASRDDVAASDFQAVLSLGLRTPRAPARVSYGKLRVSVMKVGRYRSRMPSTEDLPPPTPAAFAIKIVAGMGGKQSLASVRKVRCELSVIFEVNAELPLTQGVTKILN